MKKVLKDVSFVILLLKMCIIFGQETAAQKTIVIDVGHGGKDSGAKGVNGIQEKNVVMKIALEILRINKHSKLPLDIYLTRYGDTLISLSDRTKLAKHLKPDLFFPCIVIILITLRREGLKFMLLILNLNTRIIQFGWVFSCRMVSMRNWV